jgi:hypothetical protein
VAQTRPYVWVGLSQTIWVGPETQAHVYGLGSDLIRFVGATDGPTGLFLVSCNLFLNHVKHHVMK